MLVIKNFTLLVVLVQIIVYLISAINPVSIEVTATCTRTKQATNCIDCHNQNKYTQAKHKSQSCYKCHINISSKNVVTGKACIDCHQEAKPETYPKISRFTKQYCLDCHDNLDSMPVGIAWGHKIAGSHANKNCSSCHRLHQDGKPRRRLLQQSQNNLCISCHRDEVQNFMKVSSHINQLSQTNCTGCHQPHHNSRVPPQQWQMERGNLDLFLAYSVHRQQEFCTNCHSSLMLTSSYSSRFINGMFNNLHDRHLKSGSTCLECHNPHGSIYPHLIRTEVEVRPDFPMGNSLNYIPIGSGGMCTVRCHSETHQGSVYKWTN